MGASWNYLVKIGAGTDKQYALMEFAPGSVSGWNTRFEVRLIQAPAIRIDAGIPGQGATHDDDVQLNLSNYDGNLSGWINTGDLRGQSVTIYEHEYGTTVAPTALLTGQVKQVEHSIDESGTATVVVTVSGSVLGLLDTTIPKTKFEKTLFTNFTRPTGKEDKYTVPDQYGKRIPVVVRGTREHIPCLQICADPTNITDYTMQVRVATTTAGTLSTSFNTLDVVDGVTLALNDRILLKNQASAAENGVRVVADVGAPARADDMNSAAEASNARVLVTEGSANVGKLFTTTFASTDTLDVTDMPWEEQPRTGDYRYLVMNDPGQEGALVRGYINTVYRVSEVDNKLRVVPSDYYVQQIETGGDGKKYYTIRFPKSQRARIYADVEACEFLTSDTRVKAHWLFRANMKDSKALVEMFPASALSGATTSLTAFWDFIKATYTADSASGSSHTLTYTGTPGTPLFTEDEDGIKNQALKTNPYGIYGTTVYKAHFYTAATDFKSLGTGSFHVEMCVKFDGLKPKRLEGTVLYMRPFNAGGDGGYHLRFDDGVPIFDLYLGIGGGEKAFLSLAGSSHLKDGNWHHVVFELNRVDTSAISKQDMRIYVDGFLVASEPLSMNASFTTSSTLTGTETNLRLLAMDGSGTDPFGGSIDFIKFYTGPYTSMGEYISGHSGQGLSAYSFGQQTTISRTSVSQAGTSVNTHDFAMMVWIKRSGFAATREEHLVTYGNPTTTGYRLSITDTGSGALAKFSGAISSSTFSITSDVAAGILDDGYWHCIWAIIDRSDATNGLKIIVDNTKKQAAWSLGTTTAFGTNLTLTLGSTSSSNDFRGAMDELVFMNGAPDSWPTDTEVRDHFMMVSGNPARVVRRILSNTAWGLGQTIDSSTFDAAEDILRTAQIRCAGALYTERSAGDVMDEICAMYGMYYRYPGSSWTLGFSWRNPANSNDTPYVLGFNDGYYDNIGAISRLNREAIDAVPKELVMSFYVSNNPSANRENFLLYQTNARPIVLDPVNGGGAVAPKGEAKRYVDLTLVREWEVADRVGNFVVAWINKDRLIELRNIASERRAIVVGDPLTLEIPSAGITTSANNNSFRVIAKSYEGDTVSLVAVDNARTAATTYTPTTSITIVDDDEGADYKYTRPPAPTNLFLESITSISDGCQVVIGFTAPVGLIAEEAVNECVIRWQQTDDYHSIDNFLWTSESVAVQAGEEVKWTSEEFIPGRKYNVEVRSRIATSIAGLSDGAVVIVGGVTETGNVGTRTLSVDPPFESGTTTKGTAGTEYRVGQAEPGGTNSDTRVYKLTPSPAFGSGKTIWDGTFVEGAQTTQLMPVNVKIDVASRPPVIVVNNVWLHWVDDAGQGQSTTLTAFQFTTYGTGEKSVKFGTAPPTGATAYAIIYQNS